MHVWQGRVLKFEIQFIIFISIMNHSFGGTCKQSSPNSALLPEMLKALLPEMLKVKVL